MIGVRGRVAASKEEPSMVVVHYRVAGGEGA